MTPLKAIRAKCLECCCGQIKEVELCAVKDCALYSFRFGKDPYRAKRKITKEQKQEMTDRLEKYRNKMKGKKN